VECIDEITIWSTRFLELAENGCEDLAANAIDVQRTAFKEQKKKDYKASTFTKM
jgi:hypothetical protein